MIKNIWFSSDLHMGHKNVIDYSSRPWSTVEEMNEGLIQNWNSLVKPKDTVYFLGDFCLTAKVEFVDDWLGQFNGEWRIIAGNHDRAWLKKLDKLENCDKIKWVRDYAERHFTVGGKKYKLVLCHFPLLFWHGSHYGSIHLHGHSHGGAQKLNEGIRRMDVGVDCNNWYPVSLKDIVTKLGDLKTNPHHDRYNNDNENYKKD